MSRKRHVLTAVARVKDEATACIQKTGTSALFTSMGRTEFVNCLQNIVPPLPDCLDTATSGSASPTQ